MKIAGILFIVAGLTAILYGGFSYTSHNRVTDVALIQVDEIERHPVRIPPMLGIAAILLGGGLVCFRIEQI
jgi:hypothetical protein